MNNFSSGYCYVCGKFLQNAAFDLHINSKKHYKSLNKARILYDNENCEVLIKGIRPNTTRNHIYDFAKNFGIVIYYDFKQNNLILRYAKKESVKSILSEKRYFERTPLDISLFSKNITQNETQTETVKDVNSIKNILENIKSFEEQVTVLLSELKPVEGIKEERYGSVCSDLEVMLNKIFPGCKVLPFGSTVTGLDFKGSDIDAYIYLPRQNSFKGPFYVNSVYRCKNYFYKYQDVFTNVVCIPNAKTPIVKCQHKKTGINCDFNFKNLLGVCNSSLISFLFSLDNKLKSVMMIIKYWARCHNFNGTGKFTNYSLVILFIFYLQQPQVSIFPPIISLQLFQEHEFLQEGWNCGFIPDVNLLNPKRNEITIIELLYGFFNFYATFEFAFNVLSPYTGVHYSKTIFSNVIYVPEMYRNYIELIESDKQQLNVYTNICLQDPFEHNRNLTSSVSSQLLLSFQDHCEWMKTLIQEVKTTNIPETLLTKMFLKKPVNNLNIRNSVTIRASVMSLDNLTEDAVCDDNLLRSKWCDYLEEIIVVVLSKVFKMTVEQIKKSTDEDNRSIEFHCTGYYPTWNGRKKIKTKVNNPNEYFLQTEVSKSDIMNENYKKSNCIIDFNLNIIYYKNPTKVILNLINNKQKKLLTNFFSYYSYLDKVLPPWVEKCLSNYKGFSEWNVQST